MPSTDTPAASSLMTLRSTISAAVLDDGAVLLDLVSKYFFALNASGWAIVQLFESAAAVDDVDRLARAWGAPDDGSVAVFVTQLCEYDLLEPAGELDAQPEVAWSGRWTAPTIERQAEPLQNIMVSAFDPSIPLAE